MNISHTLIFGFSILMCLILPLWFMSIRLRDASIVDRIWGLTFVVLMASYMMQSGSWTHRKIFILSLVIIWGARLALHIHIRNRGHGEDYRYQAMRAKLGKKFWWYSFFSVFLLQAVIATFISAPLLVIASQADQDFGVFPDLLAILVWSLGFFFESVADYQLMVWRRNPQNRGKVLTTGLWSLSRHPNYFGDATVWWGFYLFALNHSGGYWTIFSPMLMSYLIVKVSGALLLEQKLIDTKPGYAAYAKTTPMFFPNFMKLIRFW